MSLVDEIEKIANERVDKRLNEITRNIPLLKPWLTMNSVEELLEKEARWIIKNFCTQENVDKRLVKKVGGNWHFRNPEFSQFIHDIWWNE